MKTNTVARAPSRWRVAWLCAFAVVSTMTACESSSDAEDGTEAEGASTNDELLVDAPALEVPAWYPAPSIPEDNAFTQEKAQLGRFLFYDRRMSGNGTQSCGSCHKQWLAFSDGLSVSVGSTDEEHPRNSPTLTNVAYNASLTWAHPELTELEEQVLIPIFGEFPVELGVTGLEDEVLARFAADPVYQELFPMAFPDDDDTLPIRWETVADALSTFCRSLISSNSPYDQVVGGGEVGAMTLEQLEGAETFFSETTECHHCHGGFNFTLSTDHEDSQFDEVRFHNTGLYNLDGDGAYPADNTGVFEITGDPEDMGKFRAPTLRNVAVTAPYMHDGSMETLEEVIRFYEAGGRVIEEGQYAGDGTASPLKSGFMAGFTLTDDQRANLIAFLESLTDEEFLTDPRFSDPFGNEVPPGQE